jgi:hypothetical protein
MALPTNPNWAGFIEAGRALIHAGVLQAKALVALVREANPTLTNEELNSLLTDIITKADAELAEIAAEQAAADGEVAKGKRQPAPAPTPKHRKHTS